MMHYLIRIFRHDQAEAVETLTVEDKSAIQDAVAVQIDKHGLGGYVLSEISGLDEYRNGQISVQCINEPMPNAPKTKKRTK